MSHFWEFSIMLNNEINSFDKEQISFIIGKYEKFLQKTKNDFYKKNLHSACKTIKKTHFRGNCIKATRFIERRLVKVASRSPDKTFSLDVGCVRYARTRFQFFRRPLPNRLPRRRRTAAVRRSRFRLRHLPTGRPTQPQRPPYPPLLRRQRAAAQHLRRQRSTLPARILLRPSARQRSRLRPAGERDVFVSEDERFYVNRLTSVTFNGKELVRYDYDGYGIHGNLLWYGEYTAWVV